MSVLPKQRAGEPISADLINRIVSAVVGMIRGGRGILVRRMNDQVVIDTTNVGQARSSGGGSKWVSYSGE